MAGRPVRDKLARYIEEHVETPAAVAASIIILDVYVSDSGPPKVIPNRWTRERDVWLG